MARTFTTTEFFERFPDDTACLEHLMKLRFGGRALECPRCSRHGRFSRVASQPAYQCARCGHHIHPMAGTPFERSRTPLQKWFYAIFLFTSAGPAMPASELGRRLGVTYKTAWRISERIRRYLGSAAAGNQV